jgi:hypothetical protein
MGPNARIRDKLVGCCQHDFILYVMNTDQL